MRKNLALILMPVMILANSAIKNALPTVVNIYLDEKDHHNTLGSGVIIDSSKGYIITNAHVVKNHGNIVVTLNNKNYFKAKLVGTDPDSDIAVIKVNAPNLTEAKISYRPVTIGDKIYTIGNPYGLSNTVTSGIVSATGRKIGLEKYENFIQIDAAINPGNSGGALIDNDGNLIGINTAVFSNHGSNIGLGFAIPVYLFAPISAQLIKYGTMDRSTLGVYVQNITPKLAGALGVKTLDGVLVSKVIPGSNAEKIGLHPLDIIIQVGYNQVNSFLELNSIIGTLRVNQDFIVTILRDHKTIRLHGKLFKYNPEPKDNMLSGVILKPSSYWSENDNIVHGLKVTSIETDSRPWLAGLRKNDILITANGHRITDLSDVNLLQHKSPLLVTIKRSGIDQLLVLE